ncbi:MAG: OmpP1/FadL family transporter [Bacteroidales bacterium]
MKKTLQLSILLGVFLIPFGANAQMDNLANMSAKWIRANARNAALDGADIVNYNPAGIVKLDNGFHISLNNQSLFRKPQHSFNLGTGEQTCKQDGADPFLPALYAAFKKDNWAISSGIYVTGSGASADFPDGSVNTTLMGVSQFTTPGYNSLKDQSIKASSYYLAIPINFSYAINDKISLSLGGRYIIANNHTKAGLTLVDNFYGLQDYPISVDYKKNAKGFGGIIGLNLAPNDKLNIAIHYETKVKLEFEADDNKGTMALETDGTKSNRDLPAVLYTGASYKFTDKFTAAVDFNYYFQKGADWGKFANDKEISDAAGNCYHVALGVYYQLLPKLQLSAGCKYLHFDYSDQELYYTQMGAYEAVKYDNLNLGIGAGYNVTDNIQVDLGIGRTIWKDKTINYGSSAGLPVDISNKAYVLALGLDIKF